MYVVPDYAFRCALLLPLCCVAGRGCLTLLAGSSVQLLLDLAEDAAG
jgi:hypothetical protein